MRTAVAVESVVEQALAARVDGRPVPIEELLSDDELEVMAEDRDDGEFVASAIWE